MTREGICSETDPEPVGFTKCSGYISPYISRLETQYSYSQLPNNGSADAVAIDAVIAVAANVCMAVAVELVTLVEKHEL